MVQLVLSIRPSRFGLWVSSLMLSPMQTRSNSEPPSTLTRETASAAHSPTRGGSTSAVRTRCASWRSAPAAGADIPGCVGYADWSHLLRDGFRAVSGLRSASCIVHCLPGREWRRGFGDSLRNFFLPSSVRHAVILNNILINSIHCYSISNSCSLNDC